MFYLVKCTDSGIVNTIDLSVIEKKRCIVFEEGIQRVEISNYGRFTGKLVFPTTVEQINIRGIYDSYISNIEVIKNNKRYFSENGILYQKKDQSLLCCPPNYNKEDVVIPKSVRAVLALAFIYNKNIKSITFNAPITIYSNAFWQSNIEELIFNDNVRIDINAFAYAKGLSALYFNKNVINVDGHLKNAFWENTKLNSIQYKNERFILPDISAMQDIIEGMGES